MTLQCHASHDPTMDLTFTWALNGVLLDLEDSAGPYHRVEGVSPVRPGGDVAMVTFQVVSVGSCREITAKPTTAQHVV